MKAAGHEAFLIDLRTIGLPAFDNDRAFDHPACTHLHDAIARADGMLQAPSEGEPGAALSARLDKPVDVTIDLTGALEHRRYRSDWGV